MATSPIFHTSHSTISIIDTANGTLIKKINLLENYDPISGNVSGPMGFLPIQTPVSPDGQYMVTANTGSATITIVNTETDELIKDLPCSAGCHGVNFGAKKDGGHSRKRAITNNDNDLEHGRLFFTKRVHWHISGSRRTFVVYWNGYRSRTGWGIYGESRDN